MFGRYFKKDLGFFDLFNCHAASTLEGAQVLVRLLERYPQATEEMERLETLEQECDTLTHRTVDLLHKTFIAPLDRDEIVRLISRLDDIIDAIHFTVAVIFAALMAAIIWNLITWWFGLPSSSSHALIGGLAGAVVVFKGAYLLNEVKLLIVASFIVISPLIGMVLGMINLAIVYVLVRNSTPRAVNKRFRQLQLFSAAIYSISHGTSDAQKTMGILFALMVSAGYLPATARAIPF